MLNNQSVAAALRSAVDHLKSGDLTQAEAALRALQFDRLLKPLRDRSKGPRQFLDPGEPFGVDRVHETGDHIRSCFAAMKRGDQAGALASAEAAVKRWEAN
jgi:hypothetical protein